jgi:sodium transport system permease protein
MGNMTSGSLTERARHIVRIILRKELSEIFRDRRTIISVVVSPLLITPAMFAVMGTLISSQTDKVKTHTYTIGIVAPGDLIRAALEHLPNTSIRPAQINTVEHEIKSRHFDAAIVLPDNTEERLKAGRAIDVNLLYDAGNETSQAAAARISAGLAAVSQTLVAQRLTEHSLPADYATPFKVNEKPIKEGGSAANMILSMMLPYVLVISAFSGAIYAAFDQVAGEKERNTLETLLISPASRRDIVLGKFSAVVVVCLISSVLSIIGLMISFASKMKAYAWIAKGGFHLSPAAIGVMLVVILPLAVLFAGLLLAVSTFARNQKEAQTYLTPLFLAVLMPAMASMFIGTDVSKLVSLVPVLNATIIIKQALSGTYDPAFIVLALVASVIYAACALTIATMLFEKESVLIKA